MFGPWDTGEKVKDTKAKGTSLAQGLQHGHSPHQQTKQKIKSAKVKVPQDQVKGPAISHNQTVPFLRLKKYIFFPTAIRLVIFFISVQRNSQLNLVV